jgi:hypothetical protein
MGGRDPREIERLLGEQYAEVLARAPQSVARDCKEVINTSLALMEHASRVSLTLRSWRRKQHLGNSQPAVPPMPSEPDPRQN